MIHVKRSGLYLINLHTRMPFRYGIAELTETPHLLCEIELEVHGTCSRGIAADNLVPKWFTKIPEQSYNDEIAAMLEVIVMATEHAEQVGSAPDVFSLWRAIYEAQRQWAEQTAYPPLLWNFGVSLVERAMIDAFCRATQTTFANAVHENTLGVELGWIHPELAGQTPDQLLPSTPARRLFVRHTVGLSDYVTDSELPHQEKLHDGLPQTLEATIRAYNLRYFKIKVSGNEKEDLLRLTRIAHLLEALAPNFAFTLDGNEQYASVSDFRQFWGTVMAQPGLMAFMQHLLFVEQPLARSIALTADTQAALLAWEHRPPLIIDESDAELHSLRRALACGYVGTSHKNCKGVFKGLANACLLSYHRQTGASDSIVLSGEDLANVGPVALLQDLAVMSTLGLAHVERNGHHYFAGLSMFPEPWQRQCLIDHADLYDRNDLGVVNLRIEAGSISLASILQAPFGLLPEIDLNLAMPLSQWRIPQASRSPTSAYHDIQLTSPTQPYRT